MRVEELVERKRIGWVAIAGRFFQRQKRIVIPIGFICLSGVIVTLGAYREENNLRAGSFLLDPPLRLASITGKKIHSLGRNISEIYRLREENRWLREERQFLSAQIAELESYAYENEELRRMLELKESVSWKDLLAESIGAEVIGRDTNWYRSVIIDRGARHGLEMDMPVVSPEGLVGRIRSVFGRTSRVMLILDNQSKVSAFIERTREQGIVEGQLGNWCRMKYLSGEADVQEGDIVRSSGLGGIYPRNLLIGQVVKVEKEEYGLFQMAYIVPAVHFSNLEKVFVLSQER